MIDRTQVQLALRTRLLTLGICTTGSVSLSATATGYARAAGSFLTDGFVIGQEVAGVGFTAAANNAPKELTGVEALTLECAGCVAEGAGTRTLSVGLPGRRAWENDSFTVRPVGRPFLEEDYLSGPVTQSSLGPTGRLVGLPQYILRLYGIANRGSAGLASYATAILNLFPPGLVLALANGDQLHVRADQAPFAGAIMADEPGWAVLPVTIPLRLYSLNSI